jgi:exosome complex component RRP42
MDKFFTTPDVTKQRIKVYLNEGKRFDLRGNEEFREISIEKNVSEKAEGSVRVRIGKTEVLVGVKMSVGEPYPDSANKGNLVTTAELLPLSSPRYEAGPPRFESIEIGRVVDRALRESGFIDFEKLCIKEGKKVWNIFVDVYSINDDGNLMDAAGIGAILALKNSKIPKYDEKEDKIDYSKKSNEDLPLNTVPIMISLHKIGKNWIVDPTREEEDISETRLTLGFSGEIISSIQKSNSKEVPIEEMKKVLETAEKISKEIFKKIEKELK